MAMAIGTGKRLDVAGLEALVYAVAEAPTDEPETDALEWKGTLDLAGRKPRFQLARTLLGFGNRSVHQAQRTFEGFAYLLAGAAPGNLCGVALPDPAEVENALDAFIAPGHPHWTLHRVLAGDVAVAVIEVAAPRDGDRICCLRSAHENTPAGRIFVRRQGQTREATPDDVRALEDRYAARAIAIQEDTHTVAQQRLKLEQDRDARERVDRAHRIAPRLVSGRIGEAGFAHAMPDQLRGVIQNTGESAAILTETRLMLDAGGAYPGAAAPVYGPGTVTSEFGLPTRIDKGVHALLRYVHPALESLARYDRALTIELCFVDDDGRRWRELLVLRRQNTNARGERVWTIRDDESQRELVGAV